LTDNFIEFNKFIKIDNLLIKNDKYDKAFIENNKVVVGFYIRIYENNKGFIFIFIFIFIKNK